ncbi:MAG: hypothetical protein VX738_14375 [Planctomycetota bacterium]|nr:hypothetical protein [Planctomycetota bacterium]
MMKNIPKILFLFTPLLIALTIGLRAQQQEAEADDQPIITLIKQLASPNFAERQTASQKLTALGQTAIPKLVAAAQGNNREAVTRSVDVLKTHLKSADENLKAAAKSALEKLSEVEQGVGPRLAREALAPPKPKPQPVPGQPAPGFRILPQIQLQVQGGAQGIQMRNVNGVKDVEVTENGRKVKIHDDPNQGIKVEIIETKEGKPVTRTFQAKNADELKKKSAEAHALYEKYAKGGAGNIQLGNLQIQGNVFPPIQIPKFNVPGFPQQIPGNMQRRVADIQLRQMERMIQSIQKQLEADGENAGPDKQALEHLKKAFEEIKQAREKLGAERKEI